MTRKSPSTNTPTRPNSEKTTGFWDAVSKTITLPIAGIENLAATAVATIRDTPNHGFRIVLAGTYTLVIIWLFFLLVVAALALIGLQIGANPAHLFDILKYAGWVLGIGGLAVIACGLWFSFQREAQLPAVHPPCHSHRKQAVEQLVATQNALGDLPTMLIEIASLSSGKAKPKVVALVSTVNDRFSEFNKRMQQAVGEVNRFGQDLGSCKGRDG